MIAGSASARFSVLYLMKRSPEEPVLPTCLDQDCCISCYHKLSQACFWCFTMFLLLTMHIRPLLTSPKKWHRVPSSAAFMLMVQAQLSSSCSCTSLKLFSMGRTRDGENYSGWLDVRYLL